MKNTTHRVVILKNINSDMISQAILILKDSANSEDSSILQEAERIVEKYMRKNSVFTPEKKSSPIAKLIVAGIALFTLCLAAFVYLA